MKLDDAKKIAETVKAQLAPHCEKCDIAGSVRREKKTEVGDIDIVLIPKPFDIGFFGTGATGIATVLQQWPCVHGELKMGAGHLTFQLPEIKLDIFTAHQDNYGAVLAHRTGSISFAKRFKAQAKKLGYKWKSNFLISDGQVVPIPDEHKLFEILKMPYTPPFFRK